MLSGRNSLLWLRCSMQIFPMSKEVREPLVQSLIFLLSALNIPKSLFLPGVLISFFLSSPLALVN